MNFRTLHGETYRGFSLDHSVRLSVPEVLHQLRLYLTAAGVDHGYIASCVTMSDPDDDAQFITTIVIGG